MSVIRILDPALANQIAAGEVIERPASVVKELLENAVDAGARTITVEVEAGGSRLLRIADDGHGMSAEDAGLCVTRHATSKLENEAGLWRLKTLGFRGEALASIAAVSRFSLTTRQAETPNAWQVQLSPEPAKPAPQKEAPRWKVKEAGRAPGTTVEVRDLFYNVPARKKFLKAEPTEHTHIIATCLKVALAHPTLRLRLLKNGRLSKEWLPADDLAARARAVWQQLTLFTFNADVTPSPADSARQAKRDVHGARGKRPMSTQVQGALSSAQDARPGLGRMHFFVNGRPIHDRSLARAVAFGYGDAIPRGHYPSGVLHLRIDPGEVDVNVHPQKHEVRFASPRQVMEAVTRTVALSLTRDGHRPTTQRPTRQRPASRPPARPLPSGAPPLPATPYMTRAPQAPAAALREGGTAQLFANAARDTPTPRGTPKQDALRRPPSPPPSRPERHPRGQANAPKASSRSDSQACATPAHADAKTCRIVGRTRRGQVVFENAHGVHLADLSRVAVCAQARALLQTWKAGGHVPSRPLLVPRRIDLATETLDLLLSLKQDFARLGLDCDALGSTLLAVRTVPQGLPLEGIDAFMQEVLETLAAHKADITAETQGAPTHASRARPHTTTFLEGLLQRIATRTADDASDKTDASLIDILRLADVAETTGTHAVARANGLVHSALLDAVGPLPPLTAQDDNRNAVKTPATDTP